MARTDCIKPRLLTGLVALCVTAQGCQSSERQSRLNEMWSLETSQALEEACRRELDPTLPEDVDLAIQKLGDCLQDRPLASQWQQLIEDRLVRNWPRDFIDIAPKNKYCLQSLTNSLIVRFSDTALESCIKSSVTPQHKNLSEAVVQMKSTSCNVLTGMTADGCFIQKNCREVSGDTHGENTRKKICHPLIQEIHKIKDPENKNLAWIDPFVIELTGNRSSARITYGIPNCHGTAQAAAGGLLGDLFLEGITFARLYEKEKCTPIVAKWFEDNKSKPLKDIEFDPGGLIINMNHQACTSSDCGVVNLWIDHCPSERKTAEADFDSGIFIDGMCVECWSKLLAEKGFRRDAGPVRPGCILTTSDHSVYVVHESAGWCFSYEATSPYGPPQLRTAPCLVMEGQFENRFCR